MLRVSCLVLVVLAAVCVSAAQLGKFDEMDLEDPALLVQTASGPVVGFVSSVASSSALVWLGIPFASPPVTKLRFQAPRPPTSWTAPLQANQAGPGCQQVCSLPPGMCPPVLSEDCLYLNVYAPVAPATSELLPVMVFIHGGNFRQGSGATSMYDGTVMVNRSDIILVTMNYRLGVFGFFWNGQTTANNGMLDQQMAMQWVARNIGAFGGDASRVTLFGQSAGASSVGSHLQNPTSNKLFQQAIMESLPLGIPLRFPNEAAKLNAALTKALNCSSPEDMQCLLGATPVQLLQAQKIADGDLGPNMDHLLEIAQPWEPTIQMNSFPIDQQITAYLQDYTGSQAIMIGSTSQEAYLFIYEAVETNMSFAAAVALETVVFGLNSVGKLGALYPLSLDKTQRDNRIPISDLSGDELFLCSARNATDGIVASSPNTPVYLYLFDHVSMDGEHGWGPAYPVCWNKVCHGSEVAYVFNSAAAAGLTFGPGEQDLSDDITTYWTNFAKTGNPNKGAPVDVYWPPVTQGGNRPTLQLAAFNVTVINNNHGIACDFLDTLGYML